MSGNTRENHNEIGRRIGTIRRQHGLSQVEFADQFCIPLWVAGAVENGVLNADGELDEAFAPDLSELCREIAGDFDVPLKWLLTGKGRGIPDEAHDETVVYLPMVLDERFFEDALEQALIAFGHYPCKPYDRYIAEMMCIEGIKELFRLYAARNPDEEATRRTGEKLAELLQIAEHNRTSY